MFKNLLFAAAIALAGTGAQAQQAAPASGITPLPLGAKLPMADAQLKTVNKDGITFGRLAGKNGYLVMFSCNTCPFVIKSQSRTLEMIKYAKEHDMGVAIVNSNEAQRDEADSYEAMAKYAQSQGYDAPYLVDEGSQLADAFGATRTPEVFLFDRSGILVYKGAMEDNPTDPAASKKMYLKDAIHAVSMGKTPEIAETKGIGCSIKRKS